MVIFLVAVGKDVHLPCVRWLPWMPQHVHVYFDVVRARSRHLSLY